MPVANPLQSSFNMGVLSPEMMARTDIEQYYRGAKTILNGITLPQGGVTKRNGLKYLNTIDIKGTSPFFNNAGGLVRVVPYLDNGDVYLVVISSNGHLSILTENGQVIQVEEVTKMTPADEINISDRIFGDAIEDMQYKQIVNDLVILSEYTKPFVIIRTATGTFQVKDVPNLKPPKAKYLNEWQGGTRWRKVLITFEKVENGDDFALSWREAALQTRTFNYNVTTEPLDGSVTDAGENADAMAADILANTPSTSVTPIYEVTPRQIIKESDGTLVTVNLRKFVGMEILKPNDFPLFCTSKARHISRIKCKPISPPTILTAEKEQVSWDDNRGWPSVAGEFGGRLVLAGTTEQPESIWLSKIYEYYQFEFNTSSSNDPTQPIAVTLATEKASRITGIIDSRRLTVFTNRTAYVLGGQGDDIITPETVQATNINVKGAKLIRPESLDTAISYVQQSGAELSSIAYDFTRDSYLSSQSSIYSAHLLKDVRQMAKTLSTERFNAEYLTVLNADGTMAHFSSLIEQELRNWTEFTTKGEVIDIVGVRQTTYALVRRGIKGQEIITLEQMSEEANHCDYAQVYFSSVPFDKVGGYEHFAGERLVAIADGYDIEVNVTLQGKITLPFKAHNVVIGLPFDYIVEPMPVNVDFQSGAIVNTRKRILEASLTILNSRDVTLEYAGRDYDIAERNVGFKLGEPPQPFTGVKKLRLLGWITQGSVKIKSNRPVPVTVLGLEMKVQAKG